MGTGSPAAPPPARDPPPSPKRGLAAFAQTKGRKIALWVAGAILAGIGGGIYAALQGGAESTTKRLLHRSGGQALQVHVLASGTFFSGSAVGPYYVVPRSRVSSPGEIPRQQLARMVKSEGFVSWSEQHGGVAGSPQVVRLELRSPADEPVTVTAIRPEIVARTPSLQGWFVASPGCGGEAVRIAALDLDASPPTVAYFGQDGGNTSRLLALSVSRTDAEQIELHASTRKAMVTWRAIVFYTDRKGAGSVTVPEGGAAFRVTSERASEGYRPELGGAPTLTREHAWDNGIKAC